MNKKNIISLNEVQSKIITIRNTQVMLDEDIADFYEVEVKRLNEQVKRNIERFPEEFMFQLTTEEYQFLRSQNATFKEKRGKHRKYLPYVFTEQGVAMLSGVLRSESAIKMSIHIINAFVTMRKFLIQNGQIFYRLNTIENRQIKFEAETTDKFNKLFNAIEEHQITPQKGIFFEGQVYDAHKFISDIIKSARRSIVIIDNYIDESVLTQLTKKKRNVEVILYTRNISKQLSLDVKRFNNQYPFLKIKELNKSHDRFIIIDDCDVYHIGASLKDLGKKWFGFSKFGKDAFHLIERIKRIK